MSVYTVGTHNICHATCHRNRLNEKNCG